MLKGGGKIQEHKNSQFIKFFFFPHFALFCLVLHIRWMRAYTTSFPSNLIRQHPAVSDTSFAMFPTHWDAVAVNRKSLYDEKESAKVKSVFYSFKASELFELKSFFEFLNLYEAFQLLKASHFYSYLHWKSLPHSSSCCSDIFKYIC